MTAGGLLAFVASRTERSTREAAQLAAGVGERIRPTQSHRVAAAGRLLLRFVQFDRKRTRQGHNEWAALVAATTATAPIRGADRAFGRRGVINEPTFAHPKLDHAVQYTALNAEAATEFVEIERAIGGLDFV